MTENLSVRFRLFTFLGVALFIGLIWLYTREFAVFSNTIGAGRLVIYSLIGMAVLLAAGFYALRRRFQPLERHWIEVVTIVVPLVLFAPLFGSLLNRAGGKVENQSFEFRSEEPYVAAAYGLLMTGKVKVSGYYLFVEEGDTPYRFKYKRQAYYPLTRPGESILLPMKKGLLGFRVMMLR